MPSPEYSTAEQELLLDVAYASIEHGLERGKPLKPDAAPLQTSLTAHRASFVSLHKHRELRGCIGSLAPTKPLVEDVAHCAYQAAFSDPRFPPLRHQELTALDIEVSVLSPLQELAVSSEQELLDTLQPGVDGLVLEDSRRRATFLPVVWESLPSAAVFLEHLKDKGGWPVNYWASDIRVYRYHTESFSRTACH